MSALERLAGMLRDLVSGSSETPPRSTEQKLVLGRRANDLILARKGLTHGRNGIDRRSVVKELLKVIWLGGSQLEQDLGGLWEENLGESTMAVCFHVGDLVRKWLQIKLF